MNRTFTFPDYYDLNRTYTVDKVANLSRGDPPPPTSSPRPYGEPSFEWHSGIQLLSPIYSPDADFSLPGRVPPPSPASPFSPSDQLYETSHLPPGLLSPIYSPNADFSLPGRVPPPSPASPFSPSDQLYETSHLPPGLLSSIYSPDADFSLPGRVPPPSPASPFSPSDQLNETPHLPPGRMRPRRLDLSTEDISFLNRTHVVDDVANLSRGDPPPPPYNSPRPYGEPSWEWHSGIQVRPPSPLVPILPRQELLNSSYSPEYDLSYILLTPPRVPPPSPASPFSPSDQLNETPHLPPGRLGKRRLEYSNENISFSKSDPSSRISKFRIKKPGGRRRIDKTLLPEEQQKMLREELSETRARYIIALQLSIALEGEKVKVYRIMKAKRIEFTNALKAYTQIHTLVKQLSQDLGPLGKDYKQILLQFKNLIEDCENKNEVFAVNLKYALEDQKKCMDIVDQMDKEYPTRVVPFRQRFYFVQRITFVHMIKLHEECDITENLRYDIINEKAKAKAYEDQIKKEHLVRRTLRRNVNKMNDQLNLFKQKMGQPISESQEYSELDSMNEEVSQLVSELVDEIKMNKELSTLAIRVPPAHIMYIIKRYLRAESYRKALTWQKKFLLLALRNCENTNEYNRFHFEKRLFNAKGLWRVGTNVIIAITRSKNLIRNRGKHHEQAVNAIQQAYVNTVE